MPITRTRSAGLLALLALACSAPARADAPEGHGAYASLTFGSGRIDGPAAVGDRSMNGRSLEIRAGRDLLVFGGDQSATASTILRFDIIHYNEGHPDNNHRDGFAGQLVLSHDFADGRVIGEIGGGPYTNMNTTTIGGVQYDHAGRGRLYTAALRVPVPQLWPGTEVRVAVNRVALMDTFNSTSLQIGLGRHFGAPPPYSKETEVGTPLWGGIAFGRSITNMSHRDGSNGAVFSVRRYLNGLGWSVKGIDEGDDGVRVNRRGVAAQAWLVQPLTNAFTLSYGGGPYWARNTYDDATRLHGLFTVHLDYNVDKRNKFFFAFSRVKTYAQMDDRDLFNLGYQHAFGG